MSHLKKYRLKKYRLKIQTITPLHIGTGNKLKRDFDYVTQDGKTFVVDERALAEKLYDGNQQQLIGDRASAGLKMLFRNSPYDVNSPLFRYVMEGEPTSSKSGSDVQEQMKDIWDRPYIPGSSLKGAIRTAILYAGFEAREEPFAVSDIGHNAKYAAQPYEKDLLGEDPYHDIFRAMQVTDSTPADTSDLRLINVKVAKGGEASGAPIELEAIDHGVSFTSELSLDNYLLEKQAHELKWEKDKQIKWLRHFVQAINDFTISRLRADAHKREGSWGKNHERLIKYVEKRLNLEPNEFILQLGWGGGWSSKTLGDHLTREEFEFAKLVNNGRYKMLRKGKFQMGDRYPKSVRAIVQEIEGKERPTNDLGWIRVKVEEL
jgi:CRISPR-associated protein Csm5